MIWHQNSVPLHIPLCTALLMPNHRGRFFRYPPHSGYLFFILVFVLVLIPLCGLFLLVARHNQSRLCFCSRFLRRFVFFLVFSFFLFFHAKSAENAELPVLESLVHAGAGIRRLCRRLRYDCHAGCSANRSSAHRFSFQLSPFSVPIAPAVAGHARATKSANSKKTLCR